MRPVTPAGGAVLLPEAQGGTSGTPQTAGSPISPVVAGGLLAGALDILYAWVFWGIRAEVPARRIFQSVAAGLLGRASFEGGWGTAALGLALHFTIAIAMAVTYAFVARRIPALVRRPLAFGAAYGLLLYAIMNLAVVPLSRAGPGSQDPLWVGLSILVHMFLIGVPIAVFARRALPALAVAGSRASAGPS